VTIRACRVACLISCSLIGIPTSVAAQAPERPPRFSTEASAVVLDVVVRDERGRPVTGLTRDDFEVFEGRTRQTISVFEGPAVRAPDPAPGPPAAAPAAATAVVASAAPRVIALVFEQLGPAARILAGKAARVLVDALGPGDFAGVFVVDRAVQTIATYAPPHASVTEAIDRAANRPGLPLRRAGKVPGAEFGSVDGSVGPGAPTQETVDEAKRNRGMATFDALSQIVKGLALLPGRKMVVLFSEGFALDQPEDQGRIVRTHDDDHWLRDGRFERFQHLLEEANAAQVAFYTFDAAGLRIEGLGETVAFGRAPHVGLLALAHGTGGAFVENTNDLAPGALRAVDDQASYYVLGFTPAKPPGRDYRTLDVRVRCDGCRVLARRGYRAVSTPQVGVRDVAPFLILDGGRIPRDLPATLETRTSSADRMRTVTITATLPESAATVGGLVTFLARVKDGRDRAAAVVSQHFELRGRADTEARLTFERAVTIPAGRGRVELVVYDHASGRATLLRGDYEPSQ
jgi:VWFA-related protein